MTIPSRPGTPSKYHWYRFPGVLGIMLYSPGIKGKSPNFYGYSILPIIEIKYDKLSKYYMTSNNRYLMLKRIGNRISFGCYYYLYDGNRRI